MNNRQANSFYEKYINEVKRLIIKKYGSSNDINLLIDLAHEGLSKAIEKITQNNTTFDSPEKESCWVNKVCVNYSLDYFKKKYVKLQNQFQSIESIYNTKEKLDISDDLHYKLMYKDIDDVLSKYLDFDEKNKYYDYHMRGFKLKDIKHKYQYEENKDALKDIRKIQSKIRSIKEIKHAKLHF